MKREGRENSAIKPRLVISVNCFSPFHHKRKGCCVFGLAARAYFDSFKYSSTGIGKFIISYSIMAREL